MRPLVEHHCALTTMSLGRSRSSSWERGALRCCESIRGRAVKALRSGRSQLCWRGFESHRMHHSFLLPNGRTRAKKKKGLLLAVPGFEPGSSGSQPLMLTTTLYHQITTFCRSPSILSWLPQLLSAKNKTEIRLEASKKS